MVDTSIRDNFLSMAQINQNENDKLVAISYFNSETVDSDNLSCMLCYEVLPIEPGSPNRLIAWPCGT
jgi:hypothetical protein